MYSSTCLGLPLVDSRVYASGAQLLLDIDSIGLENPNGKMCAEDRCCPTNQVQAVVLIQN